MFPSKYFNHKKSNGEYRFLIIFVINWNKPPFSLKYRSINVKCISIINMLSTIMGHSVLKMTDMDYKYDITLSFAGEDRNYVENVANILADNDIKVFYDKFEEAELWGKDLGIHFEFVYRRSAKYCILFISENYEKKIWTNYEIRNAISRAIETKEDYILPARFDDTEIDGLRTTIGYIDLRNYSPEET